MNSQSHSDKFDFISDYYTDDWFAETLELLFEDDDDKTEKATATVSPTEGSQCLLATPSINSSLIDTSLNRTYSDHLQLVENSEIYSKSNFEMPPVASPVDEFRSEKIYVMASPLLDNSYDTGCAVSVVGEVHYEQSFPLLSVSTSIPVADCDVNEVEKDSVCDTVEQKKAYRSQSIKRWIKKRQLRHMKFLKKKLFSISHGTNAITVKSTSNRLNTTTKTFSTSQTDETKAILTSPRKVATSKRERENGRFKRLKSNWIPVTAFQAAQDSQYREYSINSDYDLSTSTTTPTSVDSSQEEEKI